MTKLLYLCAVVLVAGLGWRLLWPTPAPVVLPNGSIPNGDTFIGGPAGDRLDLTNDAVLTRGSATAIQGPIEFAGEAWDSDTGERAAVRYFWETRTDSRMYLGLIDPIDGHVVYPLSVAPNGKIDVRETPR